MVPFTPDKIEEYSRLIVNSLDSYDQRELAIALLTEALGKSKKRFDHAVKCHLDQLPMQIVHRQQEHADNVLGDK